MYLSERQHRLKVFFSSATAASSPGGSSATRSSRMPILNTRISSPSRFGSTASQVVKCSNIGNQMSSVRVSTVGWNHVPGRNSNGGGAAVCGVAVAARGGVWGAGGAGGAGDGLVALAGAVGGLGVGAGVTFAGTAADGRFVVAGFVGA